jgi:N-acetylglucosaminyldiphosphoundecaprenol N-acetyl-beta-D-mannosaminyltransferase
MCFAVGGLFDFIAGTKRRAPEWMRRAGCEWLYRFLQDPKTKWQRVCVEIPAFLTRLLLNRLVPGHQIRFLSRRIALR